MKPVLLFSFFLSFLLLNVAAQSTPATQTTTDPPSTPTDTPNPSGGGVSQQPDPSQQPSQQPSQEPSSTPPNTTPTETTPPPATDPTTSPPPILTTISEGDVVITLPPSSSASSLDPQPSTDKKNTNKESEGLGTGSIIGMSVAGGIAVLGIIGFFVWKFTRRSNSDFDDNEAIKWPDLNSHSGAGVDSHPLPVKNTGRSGFDTGSEGSLSRVPSNNYSTPEFGNGVGPDPYAVPPLPHLNPNQPYRDDPNVSPYYDPYRGPVPGTIEGPVQEWGPEAIPMTQMGAGRMSPGPHAAYAMEQGRQSPAPPHPAYPIDQSYDIGRQSPGPHMAYGAGRASPGPQAAYGGRMSPGPNLAYGHPQPGAGYDQYGPR